jgi:hypothetical protein
LLTVAGYTSTDYPTYLDAFNATSPAVTGTRQFQQGGWLVPRSVLNAQTPSLISEVRKWSDDGVMVAVFGANASIKPAYSFADNAVVPAWRTAGINAQPLTQYNNTDQDIDIEWRRKITDEYIPGLRKLAPDSGAYMNEADWQEPEWKTAFYGKNYAKLLRTKKTWDPEGIFWVRKGVGSEGWVENPVDGRLCIVR